jgi:hypothetical protein
VVSSIGRGPAPARPAPATVATPIRHAQGRSSTYISAAMVSLRIVVDRSSSSKDLVFSIARYARIFNCALQRRSSDFFSPHLTANYTWRHYIGRESGICSCNLIQKIDTKQLMTKKKCMSQQEKHTFSTASPIFGALDRPSKININFLQHI